MTRWVAILGGALLLVGAPATADPGHDRPRITTYEFTQRPLKSGIDETLKVVAHDPDSWIYEVQVFWEDQDQNGGAVFAHTGCVQDPDYSDPGTPAKLKIPIDFDRPGEYQLEIHALSAMRCQAGEQEQESKVVEMEVEVRDPLKTIEDPDDSSGPLDIASIEQTQERSQRSATTEIVHRVRMSQAWTNADLANEAYIEMRFDLDGDAATVERVLVIDLYERDSAVTASMVDPGTGQERGYAAVERPDAQTIEVRFPPLLVQKRLESYRWYAYVDGGRSQQCAATPCTDRAPDTSLMRHRL